jgi:UDP-N-acetylglucosamine transferase subunit ALG13
MSGSSSPWPLIVALVGTDHHPFDRLVRWVDGWAGAHRDLPTSGRPRVVIQHATAAPPEHAEGIGIVPAGELAELLSSATAVVCHAGPGTIAAVRAAGRRPIVLARDPRLGEHVDDHQGRFAAALARTGTVQEVGDATGLAAALDAALADPESQRVLPEAVDAGPAIARFSDAVDRLLDPPAAPTVLFIAGWGRSGSTLLDRMLGQVPGIFSAGELRDIWQRGVLEDRLCGCGEPFRACPVWRKVGEFAFGGWSELDLDEVRSLRERLDRPWSVPLLLGSRLSPSLDRDVARYVALLSRLYAAIAEATDARVIVDSSKIATWAMLARQVPGMDLRTVHLVRDPRGVVNSWRKQVRRDDGGGRDTMPRYGVVPASVRYVAYNTLAHGLRAAGRYRLARYEDLLASPRATVARLLAFAGMASPEGSFAYLRPDEVDLAPNHTVDGNPMRLQRGPVALRLDDAWRSELSAREQRIVRTITAPLALAYGYRSR